MAERVQIPFMCSDELAKAFDAAHTRLGYSGLCERIERLMLLEVDPAPRLHAWRKHGNRNGS